MPTVKRRPSVTFVLPAPGAGPHRVGGRQPDQGPRSGPTALGECDGYGAATI